jgi:hypothetical protein
MNLNLRVEGVENLQHELQDITNPDKLEHILEQGAVIIQAEAKHRCPVRFGVLEKSITHHKKGPLTQEIVASAPYADYIEYGTFRMTTGTPEHPFIYTSTSGKYPSYRPFLRSAAYDNFNRITEMFEKAMTP